MKKSRWPFIFVLFIAFAYAIVFIFPKFPPIRFDESNLPAIIDQEPISNPGPFSITINTYPPALNDNYQGIIIKVRDLYFDSEYYKPAQKTNDICVDEIVILFYGDSQSTSGGDEVIRYNLSEKPGSLCKIIDNESPSSFVNLFQQPITDTSNSTNLSPLNFVTEDINTLTAYPYLENYRFYYPYDGYQFGMGVLLKYRLLDNQGKLINSGITVPQTIIWGENGTEWNSKQINAQYDIANTFHYIESNEDFYKVAQQSLRVPYSIKYSRPLIIQVVYPIILISLLFFTAFLASVKEVSTFISGALAILFGIYGIRQIVFPTGENVYTIIDVVILGIYIIFAATILIQIYYFIVSSFQKTKNESKNSSKNIIVRRRTIKRVSHLRKFRK
jgi:hypothetical protein